MTSRVFVAGVGMIPFVKPGTSAPYHVMGAEATKLALSDAGLDYSLIQQAYAGYVYGDSTCGQRALYSVEMTGIPVVNVNNNCSTGSTALGFTPPAGTMRSTWPARRSRWSQPARPRCSSCRRSNRPSSS